MSTFKARRPFSSSELLALRKKATEQALNAPPVNAVNLQSSSEFTARVRKLAARDSDPIFKLNQNGIVIREPNPVMKGGGTVPNNTSAGVIARQAGNAYAANYFNLQPQLEYQSAGCATLLNDSNTFPKKIVCSTQIENSSHIVQPYSEVVRFGLRRNDNKVVIANRSSTPGSAKCDITTLY